MFHTTAKTGNGAMAGRLWTNFPAAFISWTMTAIFLDPLRIRTRMSSYLQVTDVTPGVTSWLMTHDTYFFQTDT